MDNVSHLINAAMDIKSALMAVMNWTAVSTVVYRCENMNGLQILRGLSYSLQHGELSTNYISDIKP